MTDVITSARVRIARRLGIAVAAVLLTGACAAGEHAQTAEVVPSIDGTRGQVGPMQLQGVSFQSPSGPSYPAGSNVHLAVTLVNTSNSPDTLVNVTSADFTGWGIVDNAQAASATAGSGADTGLTIAGGSAQRLSLADQGVSTTVSPRTLVLTGLTSSAAPLFPGSAVDVSFRFASAGSITLHVPVQLSPSPDAATLPG